MQYIQSTLTIEFPSMVVTVCVVLPSAVYSSQAVPSGNFVFVFLKLDRDDDEDGNENGDDNRW